MKKLLLFIAMIFIASSVFSQSKLSRDIMEAKQVLKINGYSIIGISNDSIITIADSLLLTTQYAMKKYVDDAVDAGSFIPDGVTITAIGGSVDTTVIQTKRIVTDLSELETLTDIPINSLVLNEETGGTYKILSTNDTGTTPGGFEVRSVGSNFAVIQNSNGIYDAFHFGATSTADDTDAIQNAIDFAILKTGGTVFLNPDYDYNITSVYVRNGIKILGGGYGRNPNTGEEIATVVNVTGTGMGFMIGESTFAANIKQRGAVIEGLLIKGTTNARSGIRIGSDISYVNVVGFEIKNCYIKDFTHADTKQITYDKSTPGLGQNETALKGVFDFYGACGIFIATGVSGTVFNVRIQECRFGIGESSGRHATTLTFNKVYVSQCEIGVELNHALDFNFQETIIESCDSSAMRQVVEVTAISDLQNGTTDLTIDGLHLENNNTNDINGYDLYFQNLNPTGSIKTITIKNSSLGLVANGIYLERTDNVEIKSNGEPSVSASKTFVESVNNDDNFNSYSGYSNPNFIFNVGSSFHFDIKRSGASGVHINGITGTGADVRGKGNAATTDEENILVAGDFIFWSVNNKYRLNELDKGTIIITTRGTFAANDNVKTLRLKVGTDVILTNSTVIAPNGVSWVAKIEIQKNGTDNAKYNATLLIGNVLESVAYGTLNDTDWWGIEHRFFATGQATVAVANEILLQGVSSVYHSVNF